MLIAMRDIIQYCGGTLLLKALVVLLLAIAFSSDTHVSAEADAVSARAASTPFVPNWKCPPNVLRYCTLPKQFAANVVSTGQRYDVRPVAGACMDRMANIRAVCVQN
jgi:hypothetical protein